MLTLKALKSDLVFFIVVLAAFTAFRTAAYGMYYIPSESMLPTLAVGDRIIVNKSAYGYSRYSMPFSFAPDLPTDDGRIFSRLPARGDIVVFKHPQNGSTMIKRVIGLPGDVVEIHTGQLYLNGAPVTRKLQEVYEYRERHQGKRGGDVVRVALIEEDIEGAPHAILERGDYYPADDFGPAVVPSSHLFVMGDNRDNSLDSRYDFRTDGRGVGMLPVDRLVGRAEVIAFGVNFDAAESELKRHEGGVWRRLNKANY